MEGGAGYPDSKIFLYGSRIQYCPISLLLLMSKLLDKHNQNLILAHLDIDSMLFD